MKKVLAGLILVGFCLAALGYAKEITRGEIIYRGYCNVCHGPEGRGDGISSHALIPSPPDFQSHEFKGRADKQRMFDVVMNGNPETQMPAFKDLIAIEDAAAVVEYFLSLPSK
jgi:mono/diheme cytochrome c family protein